MSDYYMWHPWLATAAPPVVELFVTHGQQAQIGYGTDEFVAAMLADLGVQDLPVRWSMVRYRSFYFTSYPGRRERWCDRWPLAWRVRVEVLRAPGRFAMDEDGSIETGAFDASWSRHDDPDDVAAARCLVVSDFADEAAIRAARRAVERAARMATITRGLALGRYPQLQIDLSERGGEFFETGAEEAVEIMRLCETEGGSVHFSDTAEW